MRGARPLIALARERFFSIWSGVTKTQNPAKDPDKVAATKPGGDPGRITPDLPAVFIYPCALFRLLGGCPQSPRNPLQTFEDSRNAGPALWLSRPTPNEHLP